MNEDALIDNKQEGPKEDIVNNKTFWDEYIGDTPMGDWEQLPEGEGEGNGEGEGEGDGEGEGENKDGEREKEPKEEVNKEAVPEAKQEAEP